MPASWGWLEQGPATVRTLRRALSDQCRMFEISAYPAGLGRQLVNLRHTHSPIPGLVNARLDSPVECLDLRQKPLALRRYGPDGVLIAGQGLKRL